MDRQDSIDKVVAEMRDKYFYEADWPVLDAHIRDWADRLSALHVVPEWLPIESAPKDGTNIWAFNPTFEEQCVLRWSASTEWSGWLYNDAILNDCLSVELEPTHWQPLPTPPAGEKE